MRKLLMASAAVLALAAITPALADDASAAVGGGAGAATGAATGFFLGGPVGAVIGGVVGAGVGASVTADPGAIDYARAHRVASVTYNGHLRAGYHVGSDVKLYPVPSDDHYSYVYVNDQPALIDNRTNTIVWIGN